MAESSGLRHGPQWRDALVSELRALSPRLDVPPAAEQALPCLVLAGTVEVGVREAAAHGVDAAYATADLAGSAEASRADPAHWLSELAARVARQWSTSRS